MQKHVFSCRISVFFEVPVDWKVKKICKKYMFYRCFEHVPNICEFWMKNMSKKDAQNNVKSHLFKTHFVHWFLYAFEVVLGSKMVPKLIPKVIQKWSQNHDKSMLAPRLPFGLILDAFGVDLGRIWGRFGTDLGLILGPFRDRGCIWPYMAV